MRIKPEKYKSPLGHEIVLKEKTWIKHILKYHEDLIEKRMEIKNIIELPDFISFYNKTKSYTVLKEIF